MKKEGEIMEIKSIYDSYKKLLDKDIEVKGWIRKHRKQKASPAGETLF